jgi:hypothetical protein
MNSLSITDVTLQASDSSNSPTNGFNNSNDNDNNNVNPTIKADDLNLRNMVEKQRTTSSSPSPMTTTLRSPSPLNIDSISGVIQPNRSRTESGTSHSGAGGNPGGSADTRRRITKLSKARERAKVPRLVEYFCVVSSVPIHNINGGDADNSNNDIIPQQPPPPLSPSRPKINKVTPLPQTPNPSQYNNTNNEGGNSSSNSNNNSSTTTAAASNNKNTSSSALNGSEFTPKITARYPLTDHEENPLLNDSITAFCYPSGTIPIHKVRYIPPDQYYY